MTETDTKYAPMSYLSINMPGRANVREPLPDPEMRLVRDKGRIVTVRLSEAQLLAIIRHASDALETLRCRRGAMVLADDSERRAQEAERREQANLYESVIERGGSL